MAVSADYEWPDDAHGVSIPRDSQGLPRLFTEGDSPSPQGVSQFRRMTADEVQHWIESKTGETKIRPAEIDGPIP